MERVSGESQKIQFLTATRESINMIRKMVRVYSHGPQVIFIREGIRMMKEMGQERCSGLMDQSITESGREVSNMEKVR